MSGVLAISFLASGSSGNCSVVRSGRTAVLLDAGLSPRETARRLARVGLTLDHVAAVFLTHEHSDHVAGVEGFLKRGLPVFATEGTVRAARLPGPLVADVRPLPARGEVTVGDLHVRAVGTPHDGAESVAYLFADGAGRRIGVATDLGHLPAPFLSEFACCEVLGLEANHDLELLRTGPYPAFLKRRILSDVGHLSNEASAEGILRLVGAATRLVAALHLSKRNNTPALVARVLGEALARLGGGLPLEVASPDRPTPWLRVDGTRGEATI